MSEVKYYLIGGAVRDRIMEVKCKDFDYTVIAPSYEIMKQDILDRGMEIFLETPQYFTIRARNGKEVSDYVLARKDGQYYDGRKPENVIPGTLLDDQMRRDFTINSIAMDENGDYIDPFGGIRDIKNKVIRAVGDPIDRINEDHLRMLRALRFKITKGFDFDGDLYQAIYNHQTLIGKIDPNRVRDEITKMFRYNTIETLNILGHFVTMRNIIFSTDIWLKPTNEER